MRFREGDRRWREMLDGHDEAAKAIVQHGGVNEVLTCNASANAAQFCNPKLDQAMIEASNFQFIDPNRAHRLWASIEHQIVDLAPWVPLITRTQPRVFSDRVGNYQHSIVYGPLINQMWVL